MQHFQNNHQAITTKSFKALEFSSEEEEGLRGLLKALREAIEGEGKILHNSYMDLVALARDFKQEFSISENNLLNTANFNLIIVQEYPIKSRGHTI